MARVRPPRARAHRKRSDAIVFASGARSRPAGSVDSAADRASTRTSLHTRCFSAPIVSLGAAGTRIMRAFVRTRIVIEAMTASDMHSRIHDLLCS